VIHSELAFPDLPKFTNLSNLLLASQADMEVSR